MTRSQILASVSVAAAVFSGCSTPLVPTPAPQVTPRSYEKPTPAKEEKFHETMIKVAQSTQENPRYHRMALDTPEEKQWFKDLMYRLWDRQITRSEFIAQGMARYPRHQYEFDYIANAYQQF